MLDVTYNLKWCNDMVIFQTMHFLLQRIILRKGKGSLVQVLLANTMFLYFYHIRLLINGYWQHKDGIEAN
jgi:hypothetical protein